MRSGFGVWAVALGLCVVTNACGQGMPGAITELTEESILEGIQVREGYEVTPAVSNLRGIRFLEFGSRGELYVSLPSTGQIMTLEDEDGDGAYEKRTEYLSNRDTRGLHGMHFSDGWLWYTTSTTVWKSRDTDGDGVVDENINILEGLPGGSGHWWRPILVTETHFYTGVGDGGNIKDETDTDRQKLFRYKLDGSNKTPWSSGVRNTEKLRMRPGTTEIWGCDHGSDNFGKDLGESFPRNIPITDHFPPDELNRYDEGDFYGHPFLVGKRVPRIEYQDHPKLLELASNSRIPEWEFPAHSATNGFTFLEQSGAFPDDHAGDMLVACHGSWNRSTPSGYNIVRVLFDDGKPYGMLTIVEGKNAHGRGAYMRPVDCAQAPDGSVVFSFDHNVPGAPPGAFRLRWVGETQVAPEQTEPTDEDTGE